MKSLAFMVAASALQAVNANADVTITHTTTRTSTVCPWTTKQYPCGPSKGWANGPDNGSPNGGQGWADWQHGTYGSNTQTSNTNGATDNPTGTSGSTGTTSSTGTGSSSTTGTGTSSTTGTGTSTSTTSTSSPTGPVVNAGVPFACAVSIPNLKNKRDQVYIGFDEKQAILVHNSSEAYPFAVSAEGVLSIAGHDGFYPGSSALSGAHLFKIYNTVGGDPNPATYKGWVNNGGLSYPNSSFCFTSDNKIVMSFQSGAVDGCNAITITPSFTPGTFNAALPVSNATFGPNDTDSFTPSNSSSSTPAPRPTGGPDGSSSGIFSPTGSATGYTSPTGSPTGSYNGSSFTGTHTGSSYTGSYTGSFSESHTGSYSGSTTSTTTSSSSGSTTSSSTSSTTTTTSGGSASPTGSTNNSTNPINTTTNNSTVNGTSSGNGTNVKRGTFLDKFTGQQMRRAVLDLN